MVSDLHEENRAQRFDWLVLLRWLYYNTLLRQLKLHVEDPPRDVYSIERRCAGVIQIIGQTKILLFAQIKKCFQEYLYT